MPNLSPPRLTVRALAGGLSLVVAVAAGPALAAPTDIAVSVPGMGGNAELARPFLERFCRHLEPALGWKAGACVGHYFEDPKSAREFIDKSAPGFGMIPAGMYLDQVCSKAAVEPIATVVLAMGGTSSAVRYHVVVKAGGAKTLDDLKGKRLSSNHLADPKFVSRVIFAGRLDAATHFKLEPTPSPKRPFKALDRGEAEAALIDDAQLANMKSLPFGSQLQVIFSSEPLPPFPVVAFGAVTKPEGRDKMKRALLGMCTSGDGAEVCKALQVTKFESLDPAAFRAAILLYCK